jgi:hypothetical protein
MAYSTAPGVYLQAPVPTMGLPVADGVVGVLFALAH